jgi:hypothetical protein
MERILELPRCSKSMQELDTLNSLAIAHRSLLRVYNRYNVSEVERLYTEVVSRLHEHWSDQYHTLVNTAPDGNGFGERDELGLESFLRYMDKKLADWRAQKLYAAKSVPKSKPKPPESTPRSKPKTTQRAYVATENIPENALNNETEETSVFFGQNKPQAGNKTGNPTPKLTVTKPAYTGASKPIPPGCPCCGGPHKLGYTCPTFRECDPEQKTHYSSGSKGLLYLPRARRSLSPALVQSVAVLTVERDTTNSSTMKEKRRQRSLLPSSIAPIPCLRVCKSRLKRGRKSERASFISPAEGSRKEINEEMAQIHVGFKGNFQNTRHLVTSLAIRIG